MAGRHILKYLEGQKLKIGHRDRERTMAAGIKEREDHVSWSHGVKRVVRSCP